MPTRDIFDSAWRIHHKLEDLVTLILESGYTLEGIDLWGFGIISEFRS